MKKVIFLFVFSLVLGGCVASDNQSQTSPAQNLPEAVNKVGDTNKVGMISEMGGRFFLTEAGKTPEIIESLSVDLNLYLGKEVMVTGQYSGDTLFVGSINVFD